MSSVEKTDDEIRQAKAAGWKAKGIRPPREPDTHPGWCRRGECGTWEHKGGETETFHIRTLMHESVPTRSCPTEALLVAAYLFEGRGAAGELVSRDASVQIEGEALDAGQAARMGAAITLAAGMIADVEPVRDTSS